ncbi:tetratricopeptide repeat-containing sensor histidine kinase [Psychroserpens sp.]
MRLYYLLLLLFPSICVSQNTSEKTQLKTIIDTTIDAKNKVQGYTDLAWEYIIEENDSALIYAELALNFSKENKYPLGQAIALETKGLYHEIATGNYDLASEFYFKGIKVCETNDLNYASSIYHSLGVMFHTSDSYEKALEYYSTSYELAIKAKDSALIKKCLINLGSVNSSLEQFDKAAFYMEKSFDIKLRPELDYSTYCNLGYLYTKQEKYDKALPYLLKATEQHQDNPDSEINLYFLLHLKAISKDTIGMTPILKRVKSALNDVVGLRNKSLLLRNLADYYKSIGNYKDAITYRDEYIKVFEDIKEKQRDETVYELETKYETEKKDTELKLLKVEGEKKEQQKRLYSILAIAGLCIAGLLGYFGYKNRQKNKTLNSQNTLLEKTIDEKNVLLKEVHHRVKNSFQIVSSLLYLQSENVTDHKAKLAIKEAENRVRSMVLVHQKLYNKDELVGINSKEYISDLVKDIIDSHQVQKEPIQYHLNIEPLVLDIETMTPLGLILNELIINTMKHAFESDVSNNQINIDFTKVNDELILKVTDNGKGFEGDIKQTSFGIKLMKALSKQLKAKLNYISEPSEGTQAILIITKFNIL